MRIDDGPSSGDEHPLDAALGELHDLADLERRFALLDKRASQRSETNGMPHTAGDDEDDPFSDIARALQDHRRALDGEIGAARAFDVHSVDADDDDESSVLTPDEAWQLELSLDDADDDSMSVDDDPVAVEIEARCQDALDALEADDLPQARTIALDAFRLDDEHPFPIFILGLVAERENDLDTARDMAELSLRTAGTNPDAIGLRAHIHVRQHEFAEAENLLRFGIAHNPDEAMLHEGLARVTLAQGQHETALRCAQAALRIEPDNAGARAVRAAALDAHADRRALLGALRQGVQLHPEDPYSMVELASIEMEHGNIDRARMLLLRASRLAPRDADIEHARLLVEHVHERPLLRLVPRMQRWLDEFPGGLAGFLIGFVVLSLPLHALAMSQPAYRVPAWTLIAFWGAAALCAWLAPSALALRLTRRAARASATRLEDVLADPLAPLPAMDVLADVVTTLVAARDRQRAASLTTMVARRAAEQGQRIDAESHELAMEVATPLLATARHLRGIRLRARCLLVRIASLPRLFVATALVVVLAAPALAAHAHLSLATWHAIAAALLGTAWLLMRIEQQVRSDIAARFVRLQAAASCSHAASTHH